jgi:hypothetical protein
VNKLLLSFLFLIDGAGDTSELFSTFNTVISLLDSYDKKECTGVEIAFNKNGKYYDKSKGPNWWNYYFEPLKLGEGMAQKVHNYQKRILSLTTQYEMTPERAHELFTSYVRIKPEILQKVPQVERCLGVYYHRPSEVALQPVIPYEEVLKVIVSELAKLGADTKVAAVSPDEKFLKFLDIELPGRIVVYNESKKGKYADGEKELIQALFLSQSATLIRTANTFSKSISQLNPKIYTIDLDKNWQEKD